MERIPNQVPCLLIQARNEQDYIIMDTTRRKIIQSIAAAGVAASVPGVANAVLSGTITGLPVVGTIPNSGGPQPERPGLGGPPPRPRNSAIDNPKPDLLSPPPTDAGDVPHLMWALSRPHTRLPPRRCAT